MSDLGFSRRIRRRNGQRLLDRLSRPSAFQPDVRFAATLPSPPEPEPRPPVPEAEVPDPIAEAFNQGFAMGHEQASHEAQIRAEAEAAAHDKLSLAFSRLDEARAEELRLRLRDTVSALCETAIAPLVLDPDALLRRIGVAMAMLTRADDERLIRLHPEDLRLVSPRLSAEWQVQPDATLERGSLRIETASGGVEDGPANWRRAIAEALQRC
ncbi:MAG: flagellar biosynthesis protein [Novosphingobium sp.]|nr:flagellar biosynthesis protein [Novosphingobium sp.]